MVTFAEQTFQRQIETLGAVFRENYTLRFLRPDEPGYLLPHF